MLSRRVFALSAVAASTARAADPAGSTPTPMSSCAAWRSAIDARYRPDYDASWQTLLALAEKNGVGRAVILQPSFLGFDNTYLFEALRAQPDRFRGVPWVSPSVKISDDDWESLAQIGVRGLRFPIYGLPTPQWSYYKDMLAEAKKRDWPIHLYVESKRLPELLPVLLDGGNKVVIPHYGMFDRTLGPARDPGLQGAAGERARAATSGS